MNKRIVAKENNDTLLMYDLGQVLQIIHNGVMFNIDKNKLMKILNEETGERIPVYLFVATLPHSQYSYVEY